MDNNQSIDKPEHSEVMQMSYLQKAVFGEYLEENEKVFYIIQTHWWVFFVELFKLSLLFFPSLFVLLFYNDNDYVYLGSLTATMISASLMAVNWYNIYADAFILTNKNVIFVEWDSIVKIKSSRISYTEVESASIEMEGLMSTALGFGDLKIETANEAFSPIVKAAEHASKAEQQILMHKEHYTRDDLGLEAGVFKKALREIMDEYIPKEKKSKEEDLNKRFAKNKIREKVQGIRHEAQDTMDKKSSEIENARFRKYRLNNDDKTS